MSQTITNINVPVTLDASGQAVITFTDGGANLGAVTSVLNTVNEVATKIEVDGAILDCSLDGSWRSTGRPVPLLGATVTVTFNGGARVAGVTGTVTFGVSPT